MTKAYIRESESVWVIVTKIPGESPGSLFAEFSQKYESALFCDVVFFTAFCFIDAFDLYLD